MARIAISRNLAAGFGSFVLRRSGSLDCGRAGWVCVRTVLKLPTSNKGKTAAKRRRKASGPVSLKTRWLDSGVTGCALSQPW